MDLLPTAKKVVNALGPSDYNVLQNNGRIAHQMVESVINNLGVHHIANNSSYSLIQVDHVHFHVIPVDDKGGLGIKWADRAASKDELIKIKDNVAKLLQKAGK